MPPKDTESQSSFVLIHPSSWRTDAIAAVAIALAVAIFRFDILTHWTTSLLGGSEGDPGIYQWLAQSNIHNFFELPWFNTDAFYPYGRTLAWSDNFIVPSVVIWLLSHVLGFIPAWNLVGISVCFFNGFCTHRLIFRLTGILGASLFGAITFMCSSYLGAQLGHPQLQWVFYVPLIVSSLISGINNPTFLRGGVIGLLLLASFLSSVYLAVFSAVSIFVICIALLALRPKEILDTKFISFLIGISAGIIPLYPFIEPYISVKETFGERALYEAAYFAAQGSSYLSISGLNFLYRHILHQGAEEQNLFPGFISIIALIFAILRLTGKKPLGRLAGASVASGLIAILVSAITAPALPRTLQVLTGLALWGMLIFAILHAYKMGKIEKSLGFSVLTDRALLAAMVFSTIAFLAISFGPLGSSEKGELPLGPMIPLYYLFPGFSGIRAVSRAGILVSFFLSISAALILSRKISTRKAIWAYPLLIIGSMFEQYNDIIPIEPPAPTPIVLTEIKSRVQPGEVLAVLPYAPSLDHNNQIDSWSEFAKANVRAMLWANSINIPTINGYSGVKNRNMRELPRELRSFPDERSVRALRRFVGLTYILSANCGTEQKERAATLKTLELIGSDETGYCLFKINGAEALKEDSYLLLPSRAGTLTLTIAANGEDGSIAIYLPDTAPGAPLISASLRASAPPITISASVPVGSDRVRAVKAIVKVSKAGDILLLQSKFLPTIE